MARGGPFFIIYLVFRFLGFLMRFLRSEWLARVEIEMDMCVVLFWYLVQKTEAPKQS